MNTIELYPLPFLTGTQCSAVQILRDGATNSFSNKVENAKLFGRYLLIGLDSNGNNVYSKNDQDDTYYVSADENNTHWMVSNTFVLIIFP